MNFAFKIARRYLFSKSENKAINFISWIAALGIIASTFALIVVLSAFAGLKEYSIQFTGAHDPDARVLPAQGKFIEISEQQLEQINNLEEVIAVSKVVQERILLGFKNKNTPATLKGIDSNFKNVITLQNSIIYGNWIDNEYQVLMDNTLARSLSIGIMDASGVLSFMAPKPGKGQITDINSAFRRSNASVSGIFTSSDDKDKNYVYADIEFARSLFELENNQVSYLEIKLIDPKLFSSVSDEIKKIFGNSVEIRSKIMINDELYRMLNTEYVAVYFICTLVVIIALFNVIGSIIMTILDKKRDILTLYKLGANQSTLINIFKFQGLLMSFLGTFIGIILGLIVIWSQLQWEWFMINYQLAYPVKIEFQNIIIVFVTAISLGTLASAIASKRVKNLI